MHLSIQQLTDYLIRRTDDESDDYVFWHELIFSWESEKVPTATETTWQTHNVSIWWDLEKLGWTALDLNWKKDTSPRFVWCKHEIHPQSDDLFSFSLESPEQMRCAKEVGKANKIDNYLLDINTQTLAEIKLIGVRLRPNADKIRSDVLEELNRKSIEREKRQSLIVDRINTDENDHIHIDDWNPYEGNVEVDAYEDEFWQERVLERVTDPVSEIIALKQFM